MNEDVHRFGKPKLSTEKVNVYIKHILNWVETMIIIIIAIHLNILEIGINER